MAAKGSSSQGIVIGLVFSVLLNVILLVVAYMGYAEQQTLADQKKDAETKRSALEKSRSFEEFQKLAFKVYAGHGQPKDVEKLESGRAAYEASTESGKDEFDKIFKELEKTWDPAQKKPRYTYLDRIRFLEKSVAEKEADLAKAVARNEEINRQYDEMLKARLTELEKTKQFLAEEKKNVLAAKAEKTKEFDQELTRNNDLNNQVEELRKKLEGGQDEQARLIASQAKTIQDLENEVKKKDAQIAKPDLLDFDKPKGRITRLDSAGTLAFINLGSADNVKPGLTFSIAGAGGNGGANRQRKGSLEVTSVFGPRQSQARITDVTDAGRDPIMTGDLLFNPAWSPTLRQHVALAGLIDLTGDGRDQMPEFIRNLERQGVVVDAYLDLKDLALKGKGISLETDYLVIGEMPQFDEVSGFSADDKRVGRKIDVNAEVDKLKKEAERNGVTIVSLRKFLALIGYPAPRGTSAESASYYDIRVPKATPPKDAPTEPAKEEPK
jgi:hypothetical protein